MNIILDQDEWETETLTKDKHLLQVQVQKIFTLAQQNHIFRLQREVLCMYTFFLLVSQYIFLKKQCEIVDSW